MLNPALSSFLLFLLATSLSVHAEELPSWRDGKTRNTIVAFVDKVTDPSSADYLTPDKRIAVFDNDGTLWTENPFYFQLLFALDRVHELAPANPDWRNTQPFKAVLENDTETLSQLDTHQILELVMATHAGMTTETYEGIVTEWLASARHPTLDRPFTSLVYQPMLELLDYLREREFSTYIVSGGGIEFMRPWVEAVYGIPPEQVIGSSIKVEFRLEEGLPQLVRQPEIDFIDDKAGKPVGIHKFIGKRPVLAVGNSDGDLQMLQYTTLGNTPSLGVIIHHTDADREWQYDRQSHVGRLDVALDEAAATGWLIVDMKRDWSQIFPE